MFSEVVKLVPQVDGAGLNRMFNDLTKRFDNVARKFGDGMKNALKFGGLVALGGALISRLVNPLQRAEEVIDRILNKGDDAVTNANEFGTSAGNLLRLEALGKARGVEPEVMRNLLGKFQAALSKEQEAAALPARLQEKLSKETDPVKRQQLEQDLTNATADKNKGGLLHDFIGIKDTAEAFFAFKQSLQSLDKSQKTVVEGQVFGERVRGKASEFLNSSAAEDKTFLDKLPSSSALSDAAQRTNTLSDKRDELSSAREARDFLTKSFLVSDSHVNALDQSVGLKNKAENEDLRRFDALKSSSIAIQELTEKFDKFVTELSKDVLPELVKGIKAISGFLPSTETAKDAVTSVTDPILQGAAALSVGQLPDALNLSEDTAQALRDDIQGIRNFLEGTWQEFKTSRIYRGISFLGGN